MSSLLQDIRYAARMIVKGRGVTVAAVLTLALAIGAVTAIFGVVDAVVVRPLPYEDPEHVVMVWETYDPSGFDEMFVSAPDFIDWRGQTQTFESLGTGYFVHQVAVDIQKRCPSGLFMHNMRVPDLVIHRFVHK